MWMMNVESLHACMEWIPAFAGMTVGDAGYGWGLGIRLARGILSEKTAERARGSEE